MKKVMIIVGVVVAIAAGLGVGVFVLTQTRHQGLAIEDVLPASPVYYTKEHHIADRLDSFRKTKFWQDITAIDYEKFTNEMGIAKDHVQEANKILKEVFSSENMAIAKSLFGREAALAVYLGDVVSPADVKSPEDIQKFIMASLENIMIVSRVGADIKVAERLSQFGGKLSKDINMTTSDYNGKTIQTISTKEGNFRISYVLIDDLLVLGVGDKGCQKAIDTLKNKETALSRNAEFKKYQQTFLADPDSYGFLDLKLFYQYLKEQLLQMAKASGRSNKLLEEQLTNQFKQTDGLETMTYSSKTADFSKSEMHIRYNLAQLHPNVRDFYEEKPLINESARFIPWDAMYYQWSAGIHFDRLFNEFKRGLNEQSQAADRKMSADQIIKMYDQMLGMSIETDILPVLGHEVGGFVTDINTAGNFPIPKMGLYVQTTGRDKMNALLDRLFALQPMFKLKEETFEGETIKSIPIPFVENVQIGYVFIQNYFILSTSVDTLKAALLAQKNQDKSIFSNPTYLTLSGGSQAKLNSVAFIQFDALMRKALELIDWGVRMQKQEAQQRNAFLGGSKKNLEKVKTDKIKLESDYKDLQNQLTAAQAQELPVDASVDQAAMVDGIKKKIDENRKDLTALDDKETQLNQTIEMYSKKMAQPMENYEGLVNDLLKPLVKTFGNIKFIFTKVVNDQKESQSSFYSKIE